MDHRHAVAQLLDIGQRVRGEKDGAALGAQRAQLALQQRARLRVEAAGRLIEHIEVLAREKAGGEAELLRHALGERAHRLVERRAVEIELGKGLLRLRCAAIGHVLQLQHVAQEIAAREVVGRIEALRQEGEPARERGDLVAERRRISIAPAVGLAEIEQALEQRGLAGAVHADQAETSARRSICSENSRKASAPAVPLADTVEAQCRAVVKAASGER